MDGNLVALNVINDNNDSVRLEMKEKEAWSVRDR